MPAKKKTGVEVSKVVYPVKFPDGRATIYRFDVVDFDNRDDKGEPTRTPFYWPTKAKAEEKREEAIGKLEARKRLNWRQAIGLYEFHHEHHGGIKGHKEGSKAAYTTIRHIEDFLQDVLEEPCDRLTAEKAKILYTGITEIVAGEAKVTTPGLINRKRLVRVVQPDGSVKMEREGAVLAGDTQRNTLSEVKTFGRWLVEEGRLPKSPFEDIKPTGRRNKGGKGKTDLYLPQLYVFLQTAYSMALDKRRAQEQRDRAAAALFAVLTGHRATVIVEAKRKMVETEAWMFQVKGKVAKTANSEKTNLLSTMLRPVLTPYVEGKGWEQYLFGANEECTAPHDRKWVQTSVAMVCEAAELPVQTAHQMRGACRDLLEVAGVAALMLDQHLGHALGSRTGVDSYQGPAGKKASKIIPMVPAGLTLRVRAGGRR